jgi:hypothetical protein
MILLYPHGLLKQLKLKKKRKKIIAGLLDHIFDLRGLLVRTKLCVLKLSQYPSCTLRVWRGENYLNEKTSSGLTKIPCIVFKENLLRILT